MGHVSNKLLNTSYSQSKLFRVHCKEPNQKFNYYGSFVDQIYYTCALSGQWITYDYTADPMVWGSYEDPSDFQCERKIFFLSAINLQKTLVILFLAIACMDDPLKEQAGVEGLEYVNWNPYDGTPIGEVRRERVNALVQKKHFNLYFSTDSPGNMSWKHGLQWHYGLFSRAAMLQCHLHP